MDILHDGKYGPLRAKGDYRSEQRLQRSLFLSPRLIGGSGKLFDGGNESSEISSGRPSVDETR